MGAEAEWMAEWIAKEVAARGRAVAATARAAATAMAAAVRVAAAAAEAMTWRAKAAAEPAPRVKEEPAARRDLRSYRPPAKENNCFTEMFAERCDRFNKPLQQQVF